MSLALDLTEKATMTVSRDDGTGTLTDLGDQFHWSIDNPVITVVGDAGVFYATALSAGTGTLHVTDMGNVLAVDVPVSVTTSGAGPSLVVTFGAPIPQ